MICHYERSEAITEITTALSSSWWQRTCHSQPQSGT